MFLVGSCFHESVKKILRLYQNKALTALSAVIRLYGSFGNLGFSARISNNNYNKTSIIRSNVWRNHEVCGHKMEFLRLLDFVRDPLLNVLGVHTLCRCALCTCIRRSAHIPERTWPNVFA